MMAREQAKLPVNVFCSYADEDELWLKKLVRHLQALVQQKHITIWNRSQVVPGLQPESEIHCALEGAQIILLLISSNYLALRKLHSIEWEQAMKRYARDSDGVHIIPIILHPVDWQIPPLDKLQALPKSAKPITTWRNQDKAFMNVAEGVHQIVREVLKREIVHHLATSASTPASLDAPVTPIGTLPSEQDPMSSLASSSLPPSSGPSAFPKTPQVQSILSSLKIPREVEIIIEQTFIAVVFILADMLIVWLAGLAIADTAKAIPFVELLYNGIKTTSAFVITIRYLSNCIIEIDKSKKKITLEFQNAQKAGDT